MAVQHRRASAEELQARLVKVIDDLAAGRITPAEARRVSREVNGELDQVGAAMRTARLLG